MMPEAPTLEELARRAVDGDRDAVAAVVRRLESPVYAVAIRTLWHREDAEDATQEILVRVVTRLAQFDFKSQLMTWVFRLATNYLLDVKRSCVERKRLTFLSFGEDLAEGLALDGPADAERSVLVEEVRSGCTLGMLQCLDRAHRLAYVLGEIMDLPAPEASVALGLKPDVFRKRLQRAREAIETFTRTHCGLVTDSAACHCNRRVPTAIRLGRIPGQGAALARKAASFDEARAVVRRVEHAQRVVELHRSAQTHDSGLAVANLVMAALDAKAE